MQTLNDVHHQFAAFFKSPNLQPYAYLVSKKLGEGHICLDLSELGKEVNDLPEEYKLSFSESFDLPGEPMVSKNPGQKQPFILHNNRLYLQRYFNYESMILNRILDFITTEKELEVERIESLIGLKDFIAGLFQQTSSNSATLVSTKVITDWQLTAAITAVLNKFTIITGGPGTGKTTTVAKILAILFSMDENLKVALAAPTGKAAARMAESLKAAAMMTGDKSMAKFQTLEPSTIHRLLNFIPDSPYFKHHFHNPLNFDVVIIDESSMLDVALFAKLLDAIGKDTRLILLGDKDQLASVEAGSLFGDLCQAQESLNLFTGRRIELINSFINKTECLISNAASTEATSHPLFQHVVELKYSHRFVIDEGIGRFSKAIIENNDEVIKEFFVPDADIQVIVDLNYSQVVFEEFVSGYQDYIEEPDIKTAISKFNNLRVLCAIREGQQGLYAMNRNAEKYLSERNWISLKSEFYNHRPIIITSNNYALGLFNGDIGIIRPDEKGMLKAWFEDVDGKVKSIIPGLISNAETVYAMTIHKSQGSEFNQVFVVLPSGGNVSILTRELLYTAVTRAKNKVYVQGTDAVILEAAKGQVKRASGISARLELDNVHEEQFCE